MPADPRCRSKTRWVSTAKPSANTWHRPSPKAWPAPAEPFDEQRWRERIGRWFPELIDPSARALTWDQIAVHHEWIAEQLHVPVTVATIAQRLRDDRGVEVSESTVRRYIATTFAEQHLEDKVTVPPRGGRSGQ